MRLVLATCALVLRVARSAPASAGVVPWVAGPVVGVPGPHAAMMMAAVAPSASSRLEMTKGFLLR